MSNPRFLLPLLMIPLLAGCKVGPDYTRPSFSLPDFWPKQEAKATTEQPPAVIPLDWWKSYDDPALTTLIEEGIKNNTDLMVAASRVSNARAVLSYDNAELYPELNLQGSATRTKNSIKSSNGSGFTPSGKPYNNFSLDAVLSYEIDLWGKLRRATEADRASLLAAKANQDAIRIAVASDIAQGYFNLRALDEQIAVTKSTIKSRHGELDYQQKQYKYGAADGLTLSQAKADLATAEGSLPVLAQAREEQGTALAILLGRDPKSLVEDTITADKKLTALPVPPVMPSDTPSTLLERRPDVSAAEQQLIAANAAIGVAKADYFPTISLGALIGLQSGELEKLLTNSAQHWQYGGSFTAPILDFGRTTATVNEAEAGKEQAVATYKQTVRTAFKEVLDALSSNTTTTDRVKSATKQVAAFKEAMRIAQLRYKAGYSEYLDLLDSERNLYDAQLSQITAERDRLIASVTLYKALGGGWQPETEEKSAAMPAKSEPANAQVTVDKH